MPLKNVSFILSAPSKQYWPESELYEAVILGRSNVGKSSFINLVCANKNIAKVSSTPGHTKLLNFFNVNQQFMLVDAPGYGYSKASKEHDYQFQMMMEEYLFERVNLKLAILLLDGRLKPSQDDLMILELLRKRKLKIMIVITKKDKLNQKLKSELVRNLNEVLNIRPYNKIYYTSSLDLSSGEEVAAAISEFFTPPL